MREIVDKHFSDNWIISYYLGYTADLSSAWSVFPAAASALANTLQTPNITQHARFYNEQVPVLMKRLDALLTEVSSSTSAGALVSTTEHSHGDPTGCVDRVVHLGKECHVDECLP